MEQIPGYLFDTGGYSGLLYDRLGYYHCYAVYEDETTGIKTVWTADDSWKYDGEEHSSLVMPDKDIILTPIWNKLAEIDLNAAKKTDVWLYNMPDAEFELFEEVTSKISFPDYPEAEPGTSGGVILKGLEKQSEFVIQSPVSSDMTEEEIASDIQPYVTATDAEGNVLAKWVCTGAKYRDNSNRYQTVSLGTTITLPGDPTNLTQNQVSILYNWELVGHMVSYDLGLDELPDGTKIYRNTMEGSSREVVMVNFSGGATVDQENLDRAAVTKSEGATFTVSPDIGYADLRDFVGYYVSEDGTETYYEFLGWKLEGDEAGTLYEKLSGTATMGTENMEFVAQWREVPTEELDVEFEEGEAPQYELSIADAKIEQHASGSTRWTSDTATRPLTLESDGTVYYRATLTMNWLTAYALNEQNIQDPDFAHFNIQVKPDQNLKLFSESGNTVTFRFTCTFLEPTGQIILSDETAQGVTVSTSEDGKTYTFTVPSSCLEDADGNMRPFAIPVQWKPGSYSAPTLQEEISLEVLSGQIPDGYSQTVATTGVITGEIDPDKCARMKNNMSSLAALAVAGNDDWYHAFGQGQTILDSIRATRYLEKTAFRNIEIPANTVYAKIPTDTSSLIVTKTVKGTTDSEILTQAFDFTVQLSDQAPHHYRLLSNNALVSEGTITSGGTIQLRDGESIIIEGLPQGTTYTITEAPVEDFTTQYSVSDGSAANAVNALSEGTSADGTVQTSGPSLVAFTNTYSGDTPVIPDVNSLTISKSVTNTTDSNIQGQEFTFKVDLSEAGTYSYRYTAGADLGKTGTIQSGGTLTLKGGETVVIDGIPVSTQYTVSEEANPDFTTTVTKSDGAEAIAVLYSQDAVSASGTIQAGGSSAVHFVNAYNADYTLIYNATGGSFSDGAPTLTIPNLSADTYTLTETDGYNEPTNGNYVFIGWSTAPSGSPIGAGEEIPDCITEVTLNDANPTQTVYAVWGEDANGDDIADAQQIVIRPADITIYTGGDGYEGVVEGSDGAMTGSSTSHGLPEPGYYLVLPHELNEDLRGDSSTTGAVDLSQHLRFSYGTDRIWELELYNPNSYSMAYDYYIYQMVPQVAGQDPVRLEIKNSDGTYVTSDDFTITLDTLYQDYKMKLYTGEVVSSGITVEINTGTGWTTVSTDEAKGICAIEGDLTVRGTNSNDPVTSIESSVTSPVDVITAEAGDVTYYINDSDIPVVNQDAVALLSDELVGAGVDTLLAEAEDRLGLAWYEDYEYQTQYLDLVDTSNGNAYVTLGAGDSVDIHWPMPNGTSRWNTEFYVVHFDGLDRNFDDLDARLDSGNVDLQVYTLGNGLRIENGNLVFTTDTFSPFVLIWQDSDRDWPDDDDDDDNDRPSHDDDDDNDRPEQEDPAPELDKESHIAYVSGTPEGTIEPNAYITREEVATIFFRLLTDRSRANYITDYNPFPDVDSSRWSFYPIVTMNNAGIMHGYDDGNFAPSGYITRAEFAVVAAQFSDAEYTGADLFSDISGHWAREYINRAASEGWISGYPDGSFGPDDYITRAQVMALVNEVLDRAPDANYMLDDMITWPDNADESAWYYEDVQEATNSHSYVWRNSGRTSEEWEDLIDTRTLDELVRDAFNGVGISY